ncbi:MAG: FecR domain-containing protein [Candidatus Omnitrophica bacterium]|nr:FecR domain-containing protein [Candidatus Omnitrophota bacterium]
MKFKIVFLLLLLSVITLAVGYPIYLYSLNARTVSVTGDVRVLGSGQDGWQKLAARRTLRVGDTAKTSDSSGSVFVFGGAANTVVKANKNTEFKVIDKDPPQLELVTGELMAALTRPSVKRSTFTIKTPNGVCGVRGTGWKVASDKDTGTQIEVFEGRVKFGKTPTLYYEDPYIVRSGNALKVKGTGDGDYKYSALLPGEYRMWNRWIKNVSGKLNKMFVYNELTGSEADPYPTFQKGITYASWQSWGYASSESNLSMSKLEEKAGASWVNILVTWYQDDIESTEIRPDLDRTPTDENAAHIIEKARKLGLHVMLTPQLDIKNIETGGWRADIGFADASGWDKWFVSYKEFILYYAKMAEKHDVEILNIGTELSLSTTTRPDKWIKLIAEVRKVYKGRLVYTANWFDEYSEIKFWEYLDYAGISAYFPLTEEEKPSYDTILAGWKKWVEEIDRWQKTHGKPVIFPEIGYRSVEGAAREPWEFLKGGEADLQQQYDCYKAALETFWGKEWFYGMYWWTWRTKASIQGKYDRGYTPNDKPALGLLARWYSRPDPRRRMALATKVIDRFVDLTEKIRKYKEEK